MNKSSPSNEKHWNKYRMDIPNYVDTYPGVITPFQPTKLSPPKTTTMITFFKSPINETEEEEKIAIFRNHSRNEMTISEFNEKKEERRKARYEKEEEDKRKRMIVMMNKKGKERKRIVISKTGEEIDVYGTINPDLIYKYLKEYIKHQKRGLIEVAEKVFLSTIQNEEPCEKTIITFVCAGVSGCGKSEVARKIRTLLRMDQGDENEDHFIELRFGSFSDESSKNQISGTSQGYIGFNTPTLVDKLIFALEAKIPSSSSSSPSLSQEEREAFYPRVIYLWIDELNEAHKDVMKPLNSLLDTGYLSSARHVFELPYQTTLLVCFTANFGADALLMRPTMNFEEAKVAIEHEMTLKGYNHQDIGRLSTLIPFYPLDVNDAKDILKNRLNQNIIKNSTRLAPFTSTIEMTDEDRDSMVENCIHKGYDARYGVRRAVKLIDQEFKSQGQLHKIHLTRYIDKTKTSLPLYPPPQLKFNTIGYNESLKDERILKKNKDMEIAVQNRTNRNHIEHALKTGSDIDYLTFEHEKIPPHLHVLAPKLIVNLSYHDHHHYGDPLLAEKFAQEIKRNENLKRKFEEIDEIINDPNTKSSTKKLKTLTNYIKELKSSSSDDENSTSTSPLRLISSNGHGGGSYSGYVNRNLPPLMTLKKYNASSIQQKAVQKSIYTPPRDDKYEEEGEEHDELETDESCFTCLTCKESVKGKNFVAVSKKINKFGMEMEYASVRTICAKCRKRQERQNKASSSSSYSTLKGDESI